MDISNGKYVVFGDIHGQFKKIEAIHQYYGDHPDGYITAGDVIDGNGIETDNKRSIDLLLELGAITVDSNHGRIMVDAMCHPDEDARTLISSLIWPRSHLGVLGDYGVYPAVPTPKNALRLREKMQEAGHLDFLRLAPPYVESEDFVVIHADVTASPWCEQKQSLDCFYETSVWLDDEELYPYQLGQGVKHVQEDNLVKSGLRKTLLSGHFHRRTREFGKRTLNSGKHLLLATWPQSDFVVTYETWTQQMRVIGLD